MTTPPSDDAADLVARAALAVTGVAGLSRGPFGDVATHLPFRRVEGVRIRDDSVEVHIVVDLSEPVRDTADRVHLVVDPMVAPKPVHVVIADVVDR